MKKKFSKKVVLLRNLGITVGLLAFSLIFLVGSGYLEISNFYLVEMGLLIVSMALILSAALVNQKENQK